VMMPSQQCPLCEHPAKISGYGLPEDSIKPGSGSVAVQVVCNNCGTFEASTLLLEMIQGEQDWEITRGTLSIAIGAKRDGEKVSLLTRADIRKCIIRFEISQQ
jgi:hypothetical protein